MGGYFWGQLFNGLCETMTIQFSQQANKSVIDQLHPENELQHGEIQPLRARYTNKI
jgi:hypothetical protein